MENTDPDIARRLLDFVSGVAYATSGNVKRVAAKTYIVTPYSVDLMGDPIDGLEKQRPVYVTDRERIRRDRACTHPRKFPKKPFPSPPA